tara:strand:+ start:279 stop:998 length:720 start_codon:yes stop_codon:yes gene_type:complete
VKLEKKIKIFLGITYLVIFSVFLWLFFSYFSLSEVTSYDFIKNNSDYFNQIRVSNLLFVSVFFLLFCIVWVLLGGFGSPIILLSGFFFGKWIGSLLAVFGLTIGATLLYIFANYFLKDLIKEKFSNKFSNLNEKFKRKEFYIFLLYRFVGGIPFALSNVIPTIFNVKIKNFFFGSLIGIFPQAFIWASLGSGIDKIIKNNQEAPSITELLFSQEIYIPIIGFVILLILGIIIKSIYYKN